jgi:hypothetical protein
MFAVKTNRFLEPLDPEYRGAYLQLPFTRVPEELGRAEERVDERADVRIKRNRRRAPDQHRIHDPALRVDIRPRDQREPDNEKEIGEEVEVQAQLAGDSEIARGHGNGATTLRWVR